MPRRLEALSKSWKARGKEFLGTEEMCRDFGGDRKLANVYFNRMLKAGLLYRVSRGRYTLRAASASNPIIAARAAVRRGVISFRTALDIHGAMGTPWNRVEMAVMGTNVRPVRTSAGPVYLHRLKPELFFGFDSSTMIAEPEKAFLDYLYIERYRLLRKFRAGHKDRHGVRRQHMVEDTIHMGALDADKLLKYACRFPGYVLDMMEDYGFRRGKLHISKKEALRYKNSERKVSESFRRPKKI